MDQEARQGARSVVGTARRSGNFIGRGYAQASSLLQERQTCGGKKSTNCIDSVSAVREARLSSPSMVVGSELPVQACVVAGGDGTCEIVAESGIAHRVN